jgi:ABC-2 type transport system ATP-binding protein
MAQAIIANNVYKKFGKPEGSIWKQLLKSNSNGQKPVVIAVENVSFEVQEGESFGVLGSNGSDKSTLIRLIATLPLPDNGVISVFGYDVFQQPMEVQRLINRVSVEASFFKKLSPMENLL